MTKEEEIIKEARSWIGTPFHHQGRVKGVGVDCLGLVVCTFNACGANLIDRTNYRRYPTGKYFLDGMREQLTQILITDLQPSDVIVTAARKMPNHVMIYTKDDTVIHSHILNKCVIEQPKNLFNEKIMGVFRYEW